MADKDTAADQDDRDQRDEVEDRDDAEQESRAVGYRGPAVAASPGFLHIYKSGQGYWTRMGTAAGVAIVVFTLVAFFYDRMKAWSIFLRVVDGQPRPNIGLIMGVLGAVVLAVGILVYRFLNRPTIVDFLIATESEMKKVNWTSRKDLIGSTKVVIVFMFLIALILFVIDIVFGYFFKFIQVLKFGPFG